MKKYFMMIFLSAALFTAATVLSYAQDAAAPTPTPNVQAQTKQKKERKHHKKVPKTHPKKQKKQDKQDKQETQTDKK